MKLNLGSNALLIPGFVNVDIEPVADEQWDIRKPLPWKDVEMVNLSHVIEHFPYKEALLVLQNAYDALAPGGTIRVTCPDIASLFLHWGASSLRKFAHVQPPLYSEVKSETLRLSLLALGNQSDDCTRSHYTGHQLLVDGEALRELLETVGFRSILVVAEDPALDAPAGHGYSVSLEGVK